MEDRSEVQTVHRWDCEEGCVELSAKYRFDLGIHRGRLQIPCWLGRTPRATVERDLDVRIEGYLQTEVED